MAKFLKNAAVAVFANVTAWYVSFVHKTSQITYNGDMGFYKNADINHEKYVICFWHGDSCCYYPLLKDAGIYIVTTDTRRGAYISALAERFGYNPLRVPDEPTNGDGSFSIRNVIKHVKNEHIAITLDGPYGPRHIVKRFPLVVSLVSGKKILLITLKVKNQIRLSRRWDKFMIPLPFNRIEFSFVEPFNVRKNEIDEMPGRIIYKMNGAEAGPAA